MRIWMPYIVGASGSDIGTLALADGLRRAGDSAVVTRFNRYLQFTPWLLRAVPAPSGTDVILGNSWTAFAFARDPTPLVAVDRLCVHDPVLCAHKGRLQRLYHRTLVRRHELASHSRASRVVAVSRYTAGIHEQVFGPPRPRVIINAVDTTLFVPPPPAARRPIARPVRLLYVGNLSRRKGADLLAPIMQCLGPDYLLRYTSGIRRSRIRTAANMRPLPILSQTQIREEYQRADLLLFPSRAEGLARAVMESLACATPVVAARVSSMPEAIDDQVGALCDADDVAGFAAAVRRLTSDPGRHERLRMAARERAEQRFCLGRMVTDYRRLFAELVAARGGQSAPAAVRGHRDAG